MNTQFFISEDCAAEKLDDELIILNISTGIYHELNSIGVIIWEEIQTSNPTLDALLTALNQQFDSPDLDKDVHQFIDNLLERGIIFQE